MSAVPSLIQACRICLDTESKMCMMSKYKLEGAYENLTGRSICDEKANLTQTLCSECTQRLMNFSRLRDKSMRASVLMEELVKKYKVVTLQHIKLIDRDINELKSNIVKVSLYSDHYDSYTLRNSENMLDNVAVKNEYSCAVQDIEPKLEIVDNDNVDYEVSNANYLLDSELGLETQALYGALGQSLSGKASMLVKRSNGIHETGNVKFVTTYESMSPEMLLDEGTYGEHMTRRMVKRENDVKLECTEKPDMKRNDVTTEKSINTGKEMHVKHSERRQYTCDVCGRTFVKKSVLIAHIRSHSGQKPYPCKWCNKRFTRKGALNTHERNHENRKLYSCKFCKYEGLLKANFIKHLRTHSTERPFACELCPSKFKMRGHLTRHMRIHTGEKPYPCKMCHYKFAQKSSLDKHIKTHTQDRPFSCDLCVYKSTNNADLTVHMRVHTGEKPYACKFCKYRSKTSYSLTTHMRIHTGEKPYSCSLCTYKCVRSSQLVRHRKTHTGEKQFSCTLCPFKCTRNYILDMHMRMHTGEFFTCDYCKYKSAHRGYFVAHIKTHLKQLQDV